MKNFIRKINEKSMEMILRGGNMLGRFKRSMEKPLKPLKNNSGWGKDEIIGAAMVLVIAAFIIAPGLSNIAQNIMTKASSWFSSTFDIIFAKSKY